MSYTIIANIIQKLNNKKYVYIYIYITANNTKYIQHNIHKGNNNNIYIAIYNYLVRGISQNIH